MSRKPPTSNNWLKNRSFTIERNMLVATWEANADQVASRDALVQIEIAEGTMQI